MSQQIVRFHFVVGAVVIHLTKAELVWAKFAQEFGATQDSCDYFLRMAPNKPAQIRRKAVIRALKLRVSPEIANGIPRYCHPA